MAVIDAHAHIYPEKIAGRAVEAVGAFYDVDMFAKGDGRGTPQHLLNACANSPISHFIVHSVATTAHAVESVNSFIASQCAEHPEFIGFATMHQDYEDMEREINRIVDLGLHGIKMHPDTQLVNIDDPRLMPMYEIMQAKGLRLVLHTGDFRHDYSNAERLVPVLKAFPDLIVDAAHYGSWSKYEIGYDVLHTYDNVFVDASSAFFMLGERRAYEITNLWGTERVMFGSDYPMWDPIGEYNFLERQPFTDDQKENLFWHNAERFLGFKVGR